MGDRQTGARPTRATYVKAATLNAFYVGRGAPLALTQTSTSTTGDVTIDDVTYACATAEGGVALVRSRTTTTTTAAKRQGSKKQKTETKETSVTSSVSELARYDGDEEALTSIAIDR